MIQASINQTTQSLFTHSAAGSATNAILGVNNASNVAVNHKSNFRAAAIRPLHR